MILMKLEHITPDKLKQQVKLAVGKHIDLSKYKLFFFGSRVRGDSFERSDIDIGIEGPKPLDVVTKIKIEEEIDNLPLLYTIDFVDFKDVAEKFYNDAIQHREYIN